MISPDWVKRLGEAHERRKIYDVVITTETGCPAGKKASGHFFYLPAGERAPYRTAQKYSNTPIVDRRILLHCNV
ncbi:MAG: hypothetical protein AB1589_09765 [Cyanobacteriota bacterium]